MFTSCNFYEKSKRQKKKKSERASESERARESKKKFLKADLFLYKIIKKKPTTRCRIHFCSWR